MVIKTQRKDTKVYEIVLMTKCLSQPMNKALTYMRSYYLDLSPNCTYLEPRTTTTLSYSDYLKQYMLFKKLWSRTWNQFSRIKPTNEYSSTWLLPNSSIMHEERVGWTERIPTEAVILCANNNKIYCVIPWLVMIKTVFLVSAQYLWWVWGKLGDQGDSKGFVHFL